MYKNGAIFWPTLYSYTALSNPITDNFWLFEL